MPKQVAALYVETNGAYYGLDGVDPWDEERDARLYAGPHPVVAHPPCNLWVNFAAVNWKRYQRQRPAWYKGGTDSGCFKSAMNSVIDYGGVLEHPAFSHAWEHHSLPHVTSSYRGWVGTPTLHGRTLWTCEVWQSAYGHRARKRTWLLYCGKNQPPGLNWDRPSGSHQVGWQFIGENCRGEIARKKPLSKKEGSATPPAFRDALIKIARSAR